MFEQSVVLKTARGDSDMIGMFRDIDAATQVTTGDMLYAGQRQRTRILDRTARGVDVDEVAFHPYSTKGPYYYYPGKSAKNRPAAARSFAGKIGLKNKRIGTTVTITGGHSASRTRYGVKFSSYAAFKQFLGRTNVDLRGPSAPHMLQAEVVRVKEVTLKLGDDYNWDTANQPANEATIAIYGEEAERASGHNEGRGHLPRRHFHGANAGDKATFLNDILTRVTFRVKRKLGIVR